MKNWGDLQKKKKVTNSVAAHFVFFARSKGHCRGNQVGDDPFFFFFGDHHNFSLSFGIFTLASTINCRAASQRPAFV